MAQSWIGFLYLFFFYSVWMGSIAFCLLSVLQLLVLGSATGLKIWLGYVVLQMLCGPSAPWGRVRRFLSRLEQQHSYFRTQRLLFSSEETRQHITTPNNSTLICAHPHGVLCTGWSVNLNLKQEFLEGEFSFCVTHLLFQMPFVSDLLILLGGCAASKKVMLQKMSLGHNIALLPGGFEEAALYRKGRHAVFISERKGFVKYALKYGYSLVPAYTFGEEQTFRTVELGKALRMQMAKFRIPGVLFFSSLGYMPRRDVDLVTVVGEPLKLPRLQTPTDDQVDVFHQKYIDALVSLFEKNKHIVGDEGCLALH